MKTVKKSDLPEKICPVDQEGPCSLPIIQRARGIITQSTIGQNMKEKKVLQKRGNFHLSQTSLEKLLNEVKDRLLCATYVCSK